MPPPQQRLIVCLDGTWNNRDDSTNVLHHHALVREGEFAETGGVCRQLKYYDPGVGTGPLDRLTGGGFGFGLEENVREAYNWLVEHFHDAAEGRPADEIYIFGFSRGAYTARSLVGFISRCGLLRRGAPLTVSQLWENYCLLGREREQRRDPWYSRLLFGEAKSPVRDFSQLAVDAWVRLPNRPPLRPPLNPAERLLVTWSRRVPIAYLGIYDTVGALGVDALAIPGIRSKLALHHNMRPTKIVRRCRHALALHEHRSSFRHTPMVEFVGHDGAAAGWEKQHRDWARRVEQRWFAGAHANIGGGYADNALAQFPLDWIYAGARLRKLHGEAKPAPTWPRRVPLPEDSYMQFGAPLWTGLVRAKRNYRVIAPAPVLRGGRPQTSGAAGFTLHAINEALHPSVHDFVRGGGPTPPNLVTYARTLPPGTPGANAILAQAETHPWLGATLAAPLWLVLWATLAAGGFVGFLRLVQPDATAPHYGWLAAAALGFVLLDWLESRAGFLLAAGDTSGLRRAGRDVLYWLRSVGVVACVVGAATVLLHLWSRGWHAGEDAPLWRTFYAAVSPWWRVAVGASVTCAVVTLIETGLARAAAASAAMSRLARVRAGLSRRARARSALLAAVLAPLLCVVGGALVFFAARFGAHLFPSLVALTDIPPAPPLAGYAGLLLLLQTGLIYLFNTLAWTNGPTNTVHAGSIVRLAFCCTATQAEQQLARWTARLHRTWAPTSPQPRATVREALEEVLWRDLIGLIPFYTAVLGFGTLLASSTHSPLGGFPLAWLQESYRGLPFTLWLPLVAALANVIGDAFLLIVASRATPPGWATMPAFGFNLIKWLALAAMAALTAWALLAGTWTLLSDPSAAGWRGLVALALPLLLTGGLVALLAAAAVYQLKQRRKR